MTEARRYVIVLDRFDDDDYNSDYNSGGHDGSAEAAIAQVAAELQQAMEEMGQPAGFFTVIDRRVIPYGRSVTSLPADQVAADLGIERRMENDPEHAPNH